MPRQERAAAAPRTSDHAGCCAQPRVGGISAVRGGYRGIGVVCRWRAVAGVLLLPGGLVWRPGFRLPGGRACRYVSARILAMGASGERGILRVVVERVSEDLRGLPDRPAASPGSRSLGRRAVVRARGRSKEIRTSLSVWGVGGEFGSADLLRLAPGEPGRLRRRTDHEPADADADAARMPHRFLRQPSERDKARQCRRYA
jgi:hypothetical protein